MASSRATSDLKSLMDKMGPKSVDGVNYFEFFLCDDIAERIRDMKNIELRDDDVISVGFPRNGNHWAYEVINMVLHENPAFAETHFHNALLENGKVNTAENMEKMPSPRYFTTHCRVTRIPSQAMEKNVRLIFLLRNPKDALVSFYKLFNNVDVSNKSKFEGTWDQFFELHMAGEYLWGTWFDYVLAMDAFMKQHPNQPVYIHSFEKMKTEPVAAIKELCSFLGKPESLAQQIAEVSEFKNMKKALGDAKMNRANKDNVMADYFVTKHVSDSLLRKGEIGGWKDVFTVSQSERFDKVFKEKMAGCKLADFVREYI